MFDATEPLQRNQNTMSQDEIRQFILAKLAEIRLTDPGTLELEAAAQGGDLDMESDEGCAITGGLEGRLGRELAGPEALNRRDLTSINRLSLLLHKSLQKPPKEEGKKDTPVEKSRSRMGEGRR